MLHRVGMDVYPTHGPDPAVFDRLKAEGGRARNLQRGGKWAHLWRIVGECANVSIPDVADHDEPRAILSALPPFPSMDVPVTPLARHPSAIG